MASGKDLTLKSGNATGGDNDGGLFILEAGKPSGANTGSNIIFKNWESSGDGNATEHMRIDSAGNMGIGTNSPASKLHLSSSPSADSNPVEVLRLENIEPPEVNNLSTGQGPMISFYVPKGDQTTGIGGQLAVVRESGTDTDSSSAMTFWTDDNSGTPTEKMRISSSGDVYIQGIDDELIYRMDTTTKDIGDWRFRIDCSGSVGVFKLENYGSGLGWDTNINFTHSGSVGIGTYPGNTKLHIYEASGTVASATSGSILLEKGNAGGKQSIVFKSKENADSDYGYIQYWDDYDNGANDGSEKSLLEIGVENDGSGTVMDAIRLSSSSSTGYTYLNQYGLSVCGANKFTGFNLYYDGSWRAAETGFAGSIKCDGSGTFIFQNTSASYTKGSVLTLNTPLKIFQDGTFMALGKQQGYGEFRAGQNNVDDAGSFRKILLRCADLPAGGSSDAQIYFILNNSWKSWNGISSDSRIKLNQVDYPPEDSLNIVNQIKVKKYLNTDFNYEVHGFIAQDVEAIPEISYAVSTHDLTEAKGISDFKMLDYRRLQVHSFGAIQALLTKIDALEARIQALENPTP
jgi:hypothetical protein